MEDPPPAYVPDARNTCQPGPPADRLSIFSDLDAVSHIAHMHVQAHMRVQHKIGPKSKRFQTISPQSATQIPKTDQGRHCPERHGNSYWKNASVTFAVQKDVMPLPYGSDIQPKACRSVQPYRRPVSLPHLPKDRRTYHMLSCCSHLIIIQMIIKRHITAGQINKVLRALAC